MSSTHLPAGFPAKASDASHRAEAPRRTDANATTGSYPPPVRAWYAVGVLSLVYVFAFLHRHLIILFADPIRQAFGLTDTAVSLLIGFSFSLFYATLALPMGRLADTKNRRRLLAVSTTLWSLCTAGFGAATQFVHLLLARMGSGIGQAALGPATYSIVSDYFPRRQRAMAMGVILSGIHIGGGLSLLFGGVAIGFVAELEIHQLPLIGAVHPWQVVFLLASLPVLLIVPLMTTVREPVRLEERQWSLQAAAGNATLREFWTFARAHGRLLGLLCVGVACHAMSDYGVDVWLPAFFMRTYGWTPAEAGGVLGLAMVTAAPLGLFVGGRLSTWLIDRGHDDANLRVLLVSLAVLLPLRLVFPLMPTAGWAVAVAVPALFFAPFAAGTNAALIQELFPNRMRGVATAVYVGLISIVGLGLGPVTVAVVTDYFFGGPQSLRFSMASTTSAVTLVALLAVRQARLHSGEGDGRSN